MKVEQRPAHPGNFMVGRTAPVDRIVIHVADGTYAGTLAWFADPRSNVSAHFTVATDGRVGQSVAVTDTAFQAGDLAMNARSIGIEHEGQPSRGPWTPSAAQLAASAELVATLCQRFGIPVNRTGIIGHFEVNPAREARKNCPGPTWPWERYLAAIATRVTPPPAHLPDPADRQSVRLFDPQTNTQVAAGTLIAGTDKVYVTPATLAALRGTGGTP